MSEPIILVFTRAPEAGKTKTRLIPALGPQRAAWLHAALTRRTVKASVDSHAGRVELWCTPTTAHPFFLELEQVYGVQRHLQSEGDLGERMRRALDTALAIAPAAVLVGSDSPDLEAEDVRSAVRALTAGYDSVLGPSTDGGYLLIGLRRPAPELFWDMPWGTAGVLAQTRERLRSSGCQWHELPVRHDVDRPEDLLGFPFLQEWSSEVPDRWDA